MLFLKCAASICQNSMLCVAPNMQFCVRTVQEFGIFFLENNANNKAQYLFKLDSATALRKRLIVLMGISPVHCSFFILLTLTAIIQ